MILVRPGRYAGAMEPGFIISDMVSDALRLKQMREHNERWERERQNQLSIIRADRSFIANDIESGRDKTQAIAAADSISGPRHDDVKIAELADSVEEQWARLVDWRMRLER